MKAKQDQEVVKAKDEVIGVTVKSESGDDIGEISEIMLDKESGRVAYAILESGGFFGINEKLRAIPWRAFYYDPSDECFKLKLSSDQIKNAPDFDKNEWPDMSDRQWGESLSEYYDAKGYWE